MSTFFVWGDENDPNSATATAIKLHKEGLSCAQIARRIGHPSRSAVIGKLFRLGYTAPKKAKTIDVPRQHVRKPGRANRAPKQNPTLDKAYAPEAPGEALVARNGEAIEVPVRQRKQLVDLELGDCRFPYGDIQKDPANFYFCGGKSVPGLAYCVDHARCCYETQAMRTARQSAGAQHRTGFTLPPLQPRARIQTAAHDAPTGLGGDREREDA